MFVTRDESHLNKANALVDKYMEHDSLVNVRYCIPDAVLWITSASQIIVTLKHAYADDIKICPSCAASYLK